MFSPGPFFIFDEVPSTFVLLGDSVLSEKERSPQGAPTEVITVTLTIDHGQRGNELMIISARKLRPYHLAILKYVSLKGGILVRHARPEEGHGERHTLPSPPPPPPLPPPPPPVNTISVA